MCFTSLTWQIVKNLECFGSAFKLYAAQIPIYDSRIKFFLSIFDDKAMSSLMYLMVCIVQYVNMALRFCMQSTN